MVVELGNLGIDEHDAGRFFCVLGHGGVLNLKSISIYPCLHSIFNI